MGFLSFFKNLGRKIVGAGSYVGRKILGVGDGARKVIGGAYNVIKKIPVVGDVVDKVLDTKLIGGQSVKDIANKASAGLDTVDSISRGDVRGAIDNGRRVVGLRRGGKAGYTEPQHYMHGGKADYKDPWGANMGRGIPRISRPRGFAPVAERNY